MFLQSEPLPKATLAALTARSTSACKHEDGRQHAEGLEGKELAVVTLSASETSAIFLPVAGFAVGNVFPEAESTNSLPMNSCKNGQIFR